MRRTALFAVLAGLVAVPQAEAAPAAPAPTLVVSVTAQGQKLPDATTTAKWLVGTPGVIGELDVDSYNPPGAVTTVAATWTSREIRSYDRIPAFEYKIETAHQGVPTSSTPASVTYGLRYRESGGRWSRWYDQDIAYVAGSPVNGIFADAKVSLGARRKKVQLQFRIRTELADVAKEHQVWKLLANT